MATQIVEHNPPKQETVNKEMDSGDTRLAAERIAQLEAEIETRRHEIYRLQKDKNGPAKADEKRDQSNESHNESESLHQSMKDLIVLWEQRLGKNEAGYTMSSRSNKVPIHFQSDAFHASETNGPPAIVYTSSMDSDETRDGPPCSRNNNEHWLQPFASSGRHLDTVETQLQVSLRMIEERDQKIEKLENIINSDIEIIKKMKEMMEKMVDERIEAKSVSSKKMIPEELNCNLALQEKHNKAKECADLQDELKGLKAHSSNQENVIEFLKAEMVTLLVSKQMVENELELELDLRDRSMAILESSFREKSRQSNRLITQLGSCNSLLEDQIEILKAENVRLRLRSQLLEEEKTISEQAMQTEMQLFYIENNRHEIL